MKDEESLIHTYESSSNSKGNVKLNIITSLIDGGSIISLELSLQQMIKLDSANLRVMEKKFMALSNMNLDLDDILQIK